jgi:hypothetical protein
MKAYTSLARGSSLRLLGGIAVALSGTAALPAAIQAAEIIITVTDVKAIDAADVFSRPDFFARVTIAGETFSTKVVRNQADIKPNWTVRKTVPRGTHDVKLALFDKDLTKNEAIDINTRDNKRDLDFRVNTRNCRVLDLSGVDQGCRVSITRAGKEKKAAQIGFTVEIVR